MYINSRRFSYYSSRYHKEITIPLGYISDGATGGLDVCDDSFYVHDWLCGNWVGKGPRPPKGLFDDGTKCTNWQASTIHCDILKECGLWYMVPHRWLATFTFGGGEARKNGMFKL